VVEDSVQVVEVQVVAGKISLLIFLTLTSLPLYGFQNQIITIDTLYSQLDPVVISVNRNSGLDSQTPFSLSIVRIDENSRITTPRTGINSLLRSVPGVYVSNRDNYSLGERLSVRGMGWRAAFGVRGIQVVLDGIPLTSPDGQTILEIVDPNLIRQVEAIRGPNALFWGNGSGGTLFFSSESDESDPSLSIRSFTGSYGTLQNDIVGRFPVFDGRLTISGSNFETIGYRDHSKATIRRGGMAYSKSISEKSKVNYNILGVFAPEILNPGSLNQSQLDNDRSAANPLFIPQKAGKSYTHITHGLRYTRESNTDRFESVIYNTFRSLENPIQPSIIEIERISGGLRNSYQYRIDSWIFNVSADFALQSDLRSNYVNRSGEKGNRTIYQKETVRTMGFAGVASYNVKRWTVTSGVRYDGLFFNVDDRSGNVNNGSGDRFLSSITPQLGINYRMDTATLFAGLTTSFESPTTTELANRPDLSPGFNQDLDPETSIGTEFGVRGYIPTLKTKYDFSLYSIWVNDRLISFQTEQGGDRNFFENAGKSTHNGFESMIEISPFTTTIFTISYTYSDFKISSNENGLKGKTIPGIPKHLLQSSINQKLGIFSASIDATYNDKMFANSMNSIKNDSFTVIDFKLSANVAIPGYKTVVVNPFLTIRNILDTEYNSSVSINAFGGRFFEPAMPRNYLAGVAVRL
jgi:iron complex outermembrane receptor protein